MGLEQARPLTFTSGAVVSARRFVKLNTSGKAIQATAGGADALGISAEATTAADKTFHVDILDGSKLVITAGAALTLGDRITSDATGRAVAAVSGDQVLGVVQEAAGAAGEEVTIVTQRVGEDVPTLTSGAAFAINRFLKINSAGKAIQATAGDDAVAISLAAAAGADETIQVAYLDGRKRSITSGAALATLGTIVASDATGRAVATTSTDRELGVTLETAAGADETIQILATKGGGITP